MTREVKLSLIIGFTVTLVVAILLSDHLSQARLVELDEGLTPTPAPPVLMTTRTPLDRALSAVDDAGDSTGEIDREDRGGSEPVGPDEGSAPLIINQSLERPRGGAGGTAGRTGSTSGGVASLRTALHNFTSSLAGSASDRPESFDTDEARGSGQTRTPEPDGVWYTVRRNDSLIGVARRLLGDGSRWTEIQRANPDRVGSNGSVRVGVRLWVPGATERRSSTPPAERNENRANTREYTVESGDSLSRIAARLLGSSSRMDELMELNGITDPNRIRVGQTLRLPPR